MLARVLRFLVVIAVGLFALRAFAHQIECEKEVGLVLLNEDGSVTLGEDGLPVFLAPPSTVLTIDSYPATIGWRMHVDNLAHATSIINAVEDPTLASTVDRQFFGTLPAPGVGIPVGSSIEGVVVERIDSFAQCVGTPPTDNLIVGSGGGVGAGTGTGAGGGAGMLLQGGDLVCRDLHENVAIISTHADETGCRARIQCRGAPDINLLQPPPVQPPVQPPQPPPQQPL